MLGFEPRIYDVGSDPLANCATTTALQTAFFMQATDKSKWNSRFYLVGKGEKAESSVLLVFKFLHHQSWDDFF